jgi:glycerophosphoryl diester phosphodiesterase
VLRLQGNGRPLAIGHRGAAALAPENTLASLQAAVAHGVDVVEFDVIERPDRALVLAHSAHETQEGQLHLDDAFEWFRGETAGLHVDVKGVGFEDRIVEALDRHGLAERAFVSTSRPPSVRRFAELAPELPRAFSYPEDRLGVSKSALAAPLVAGGVRALRRALPRRIAGMLSRSEATAASLHHALLSRATVHRCHALGIPVIAWTVNDPERVRELVALGVDAVVSDDPRIFAATLSP